MAYIDPESVEFCCSCCNGVTRASRSNLDRIVRALALRHPQGCAVLSLDLVPEDIDLTDDDLPASAIRRIIEAAVTVKPGAAWPVGSPHTDIRREGNTE